jgi:CheY-like chemotaxis protein
MSKTGPFIIIDDDNDEQFFCKTALSSLKLKNDFRFFNNGKEAFEYLKNTDENPFMILCDLKMPVMDGIELRQQITQTPHLVKKATPFIFRTGTTTSEDVQRSYELAVQGFFEKTDNIKELEEQLRLIVVYWQHCLEPKSFN